MSFTLTRYCSLLILLSLAILPALAQKKMVLLIGTELQNLAKSERARFEGYEFITRPALQSDAVKLLVQQTSPDTVIIRQSSGGIYEYSADGILLKKLETSDIRAEAIAAEKSQVPNYYAEDRSKQSKQTQQTQQRRDNQQQQQPYQPNFPPYQAQQAERNQQQYQEYMQQQGSQQQINYHFMMQRDPNPQRRQFSPQNQAPYYYPNQPQMAIPQQGGYPQNPNNQGPPYFFPLSQQQQPQGLAQGQANSMNMNYQQEAVPLNQMGNEADNYSNERPFPGGNFPNEAFPGESRYSYLAGEGDNRQADRLSLTRTALKQGFGLAQNNTYPFWFNSFFTTNAALQAGFAPGAASVNSFPAIQFDSRSTASAAVVANQWLGAGIGLGSVLVDAELEKRQLEFRRREAEKDSLGAAYYRFPDQARSFSAPLPYAPLPR